MNPMVKEKLFAIAQDSSMNSLQGNHKDFSDVLDETENNGICLTAKNYMAADGVATKLHMENKTNFMVKGPMGIGCNLGTEGIYVAFAGGTGALVYLDIVARLILQNSGNLPPTAQPFSDSFSFHFFVTFASRKEAIGIELCETLVLLNKVKGFENFHFTARISSQEGPNGTSPRWDGLVI